MNRSTIATLIAFAALFAGSFARNMHRSGGDWVGYLQAGDSVLRGDSFYSQVGTGTDVWADRGRGVNTWPPVFSVLCVPLALLSHLSLRLARALWLVTSAVAVAAILRITVALAPPGRRLTLRPDAAGLPLGSSAVVIPFLVTLRFFLEGFDRLQVNPLILLCCLAGCLRLARGRPVSGGALLGFATALKVFPVLFLAYLAWKKWWRALGSAAITMILTFASPVLVFGTDRTLQYVQRWREIASGGWPVRESTQSIYAMVDRLYSYQAVAWTPEVGHLTASNDPVVSAIVAAILAATASVFMLATRRGGEEPSSPAVTVELAFVLLAAVLFSPLAWTHYFIFSILAFSVLWQAATCDTAPGEGRTPVGEHSMARVFWVSRPAQRRLRRMAGCAAVLVTLPWPGVVGKSFGRTLETLSFVTLGGLVALAALLYLRVCLGAHERTGASPRRTLPA